MSFTDPESIDVPRKSRAIDDLRALLTARAARFAASTLRGAYATLAASLIEHGDGESALTAVDRALAQPGPAPTSADLHALRATAVLLSPEPRPADLLRSVLISVADGSPSASPAITAAMQCVVPSAAASLRGWVEKWLPDVRRSLGDSVYATALVFAAIVCAVDGAGTRAFEFLQDAANLDLDGARTLWRGWLADGGRSLMEQTPGRAAYAGSLSARAEMALGDRVAALRLAEEVIEAGTTAPQYGELEAYWLRADLADRPAADRAADYVQVGNRLTWRGRRRDLIAAVRVYQQAIKVEPEYLDAYWGLSDARRILARLQVEKGHMPTAVRDLRAALDDWDRGRAYGPPDTAWAWLVRAQVCRDMAGAEPDRWAAWQLETLSSAAACTIRFPDWSAGWAMLANAYLDLRLWTGAAWAARRCQEITGEWTQETLFEAAAIMSVLLVLAPDEAVAQLPALAAAVPEGDDTAVRFAAACAVVTGRDLGAAEPVGSDALAEDWWIVWTARAGLLSGGLTADVARSWLEKVDQRVDERPVLLAERCLVRVLLGDYDDALQLWERAWALRDEVDVDLIDLAGIDLHLHFLLPGRPRRIHDAIPRTQAGAMLLRAELDWVRKQVDDSAELDAALRMVDAAVPEVNGLDDADPDLVVAALDRFVLRLTDRRRVDAVTTARAHAASTLKRQLADADDLPPTLRVCLGADLVPVDASERWQDWSLFRESIPRAKAVLHQSLGVPTPGVRVVDAPELARDEFQVEINGVPVARGCVPNVPPAGALADYVSNDLWSPAISALERAVRADPTATFLPSIMEDLVDEWTALGTEASQLAEQVSSERALRIGVWQQLHHRLSRDGRVPAWTEGLRDFVADAVARRTSGVEDDRRG